MPLVKRADGEPGVGHPLPDCLGRPHERSEHTLDFLAARPREEEDKRPLTLVRSGLGRRSKVVKKGMADERATNAPVQKPLVLERKRREHVVDEPPHLADPPARPGPDLRRAVVDHGDAVPLRPPGQPPMKAGEVDQHAGIGPGVEEAPLRPPGQVDEAVDVEHDPQNPHHRQPRRVGHDLDPRGRHLLAAEARALGVGTTRPNSAHQQRGMVVARGLAGRDEDAHGRAPPGNNLGGGSIPCGRWRP